MPPTHFIPTKAAIPPLVPGMCRLGFGSEDVHNFQDTNEFTALRIALLVGLLIIAGAVIVALDGGVLPWP